MIFLEFFWYIVTALIIMDIRIFEIRPVSLVDANKENIDPSRPHVDTPRPPPRRLSIRKPLKDITNILRNQDNE